MATPDATAAEQVDFAAERGLLLLLLLTVLVGVAGVVLMMS